MCLSSTMSTSMKVRVTSVFFQWSLRLLACCEVLHTHSCHVKAKLSMYQKLSIIACWRIHCDCILLSSLESEWMWSSIKSTILRCLPSLGRLDRYHTTGTTSVSEHLSEVLNQCVRPLPGCKMPTCIMKSLEGNGSKRLGRCIRDTDNVFWELADSQLRFCLKIVFEEASVKGPFLM